MEVTIDKIDIDKKVYENELYKYTITKIESIEKLRDNDMFRVHYNVINKKYHIELNNAIDTIKGGIIVFKGGTAFYKDYQLELLEKSMKN